VKKTFSVERKMITVRMADESEYTVKTLLGKGDSNAKLTKSDKAGKGYLTVGLSLAPADTSGYNVCPNASPGCKSECLYYAGMGVYQNVQNARIAKTLAFYRERETFLQMLHSEIAQAERRTAKQGKTLAVRLNVLSDIPWEAIAKDLLASFPNVVFYDYTKSYKRMVAYGLSRQHNDSTFFPLNYHLTFSRSEINVQECNAILYRKYGNVAVVFDKKELPQSHWGWPVVNGDETDLRFLDPPGVVVGLYAKGRAKKDTTGFVVRTPLTMVA
jgi:hypothetical protein